MTDTTQKLPNLYIDKWQLSITLIRKFFDVQAALITHVVDGKIEVLVCSKNKNSPFEFSAKQNLDCSLYCEEIISKGKTLCIENVMLESNQRDSLNLNHGVAAFLGHPIYWPNDEILGTICILDNKKRHFTEEDITILKQLRYVIEADLNIIFQTKISNENQLLLKESLEQKTKALMAEIKERKLRELELREYEVIVANSTDMLALVDTNYTYKHVNQCYLDTFKISKEDIVGKTINEILGSKLFEEIIKPKFLACFAGEIISYQHWFTYPASGKRFLDATYSPYYGEDNKVQGVVVRVHDITEITLLNQQLLQAQKMESIGLLAGGVAHDLNNALTVIMGGVELSKHYTNEDDPINDFLDQIMSASKHSSDIIRQLLTFARKQNTSPKVIDLNANVDNMIKTLGGLIGNNIEFNWKQNTRVWPVAIDPIQLEQILINLCSNARDSITHAKGEISIELSNIKISTSVLSEFSENIAAGNYVVLQVTDNGHGIEKTKINKIFDPFFTTKDIGKGTGLGLATVYGITKQNKGYIDIESKVNKGTMFKIYFPKNIENVKEKIENKIDSSPTGYPNEVILLVEDDKLILEQTQRLLKNLGYSVLTADSPGKAISVFEQHGNEIKLLLTDVIMPKMNGRDLYIEINKSFPETKVLFMSGYASTIINHQELLEKNVNFLQKPFSRYKLALAVRNTIDN